MCFCGVADFGNPFEAPGVGGRPPAAEDLGDDYGGEAAGVVTRFCIAVVCDCVFAGVVGCGRGWVGVWLFAANFIVVVS